MKRKYDCIPEINDIEKYLVEWLDWWMGLQPEWRWVEKSGNLLLPLTGAPSNEEFAILRKGGPSGLVVALIGLKWWGYMRESDKRWLAAVADVKGCVERFRSVGKKRKAESGGRGKGKKKKMQ